MVSYYMLYLAYFSLPCKRKKSSGSVEFGQIYWRTRESDGTTIKQASVGWNASGIAPPSARFQAPSVPASNTQNGRVAEIRNGARSGWYFATTH
jgi:hypothetical protein